MKILKKISCIILIISLVLTVILYIFNSVYSHIKTVKMLYNCIHGTYNRISDRFDRTLGTVEFAKNLPVSLNISSSLVTNPFFSDFFLSNNTEENRFELSLNKLRLNNENIIDIKSYISDDKIGFMINDDPELCYSASTNDFCTGWNQSIYSNIFTIPSFIPDNVGYDSIEDTISDEGIAKCLIAMMLGDINIDPGEIINNVKVSKPEKYIFNGTKYIKLTISKSYVNKLFESFLESSENALFDFAAPVISDLYNMIKYSENKKIEIAFITSDNMIKSAETSLITKDGIINFYMHTDENEVGISCKNITGRAYQGKDIMFRLMFGNDNCARMFLYNNRTIMADLSITGNNKTFFADFAYVDRNMNTQAYTLSVCNTRSDFTFPENEKNIYSISVAELFGIFNMVGNFQN